MQKNAIGRVKKALKASHTATQNKVTFSFTSIKPACIQIVPRKNFV